MIISDEHQFSLIIHAITNVSKKANGYRPKLAMIVLFFSGNGRCEFEIVNYWKN